MIWDAIVLIMTSLRHYVITLSWRGSSVMNLWIHLNTLKYRQNGRHCAADIVKLIFIIDSSMFIKISLRYYLRGQWILKSTLGQFRACGGPGDKPLSEPSWPSFNNGWRKYLLLGLDEITLLGVDSLHQASVRSNVCLWGVTLAVCLELMLYRMKCICQ